MLGCFQLVSHRIGEVDELTERVILAPHDKILTPVIDVYQAEQAILAGRPEVLH